MKKTIQQMQLEKLCTNMIKDFEGEEKIPEQVDIESFVTNYLGYKILYENFVDRNKLGYTSDGESFIEVFRDELKIKVQFPEKTIVIDKFFLNDNQLQNRREIIAHEVGHIIYGLVEGKPVAGFYSDRADGYSNFSFLDIQKTMSINEVKADNYAVAILMPDYIIMNLINKYHDGKKFMVYDGVQFLPEDRNAFEKIARALAVSNTALFHRLKGLGGLVENTDNTYLKKLNIGGRKKNG